MVIRLHNDPDKPPKPFKTWDAYWLSRGYIVKERGPDKVVLVRAKVVGEKPTRGDE